MSTTAFRFPDGTVLAAGQIMPPEVKLRTLQLGDGFYLHLEATTGRLIPGFLHSLGEGSATVIVTERHDRVIRTSEGVEKQVSSITGLQHWCLDTLVIPDGTRHDLTQVQQYQKSTQTEKGAINMKKEKAAKKPQVYKVVTYEPAAKAATDKGKELAKKESHNGVLLAAIVRSPGMTFQELVAKVGLKAFGSESKNVESIFRWHVTDLMKKGFIKSVEDKVKAASMDEARAGEGKPAEAAAAAE